ncbi:rhamnogalacturonan lyase B N-terminal domain-containing protein [Streptomyces sp. NPDC048389]|uniref:rhamnogalacturonan lyase B N-terminal domain-containing protein n=1 Tax=Streptomyces sp. NPDC048389 TaxID=3154622 RepID=UPI0034521D66
MPTRRRTFVLGPSIPRLLRSSASRFFGCAVPRLSGGRRTGRPCRLARPSASAAASGYAEDGSRYVVDTGTQLVPNVGKADGDLTSPAYRGTECQSRLARTRTSSPASAAPA